MYKDLLSITEFIGEAEEHCLNPCMISLSVTTHLLFYNVLIQKSFVGNAGLFLSDFYGSRVLYYMALVLLLVGAALGC